MTWQRFVLSYGWKARGDHLAFILEQPRQAIETLRRTGAVTKGKRRTFAELFTLRNGRPPADDEWPVPIPMHQSHEWLQPELALIARLVGTVDAKSIAQILTTRLQRLTGDPSARRKVNAVQTAINRLGLQSSDVVGGLTVRDAAARAGSLTVVQQAIWSGRLPSRRVGRLHVIPPEVFEAWLAARDRPPAGYVRLATIRKPLGIKSDSKLPEYATLGYIPDTVYVRSSHLWFIAPDRAQQIVADARAGRPLPWHGKPLPGNLKVTWRKYQRRRHRWCRVCSKAWGGRPPKTFEDFCRRYPAIDYGVKRHMTTKRNWRWTPRKPWGFHRAFSGHGVTIAKAARQLEKPRTWIWSQIRAGVIRPLRHPTDRGAALRISPAALARLRRTPVIERRGRKPGVWLGVYAAAKHTGVTIGTVRMWADDEKSVRHKWGARGWLFGLTSLEQRARRYWTSEVRFKRATPPAWLTDSAAA